MFARRFFGFALLTLPAFVMPLHASTLSFSIDNDSLAGTDREYSSGLFLRWSSTYEAINYSVEMASQLWTPSDIEQSLPQPNERPYTGLFYLKSRAYQQTINQTIIGSFLIGTVGDSSKAEYGQSFMHSIVGSPDPKGWEYQIYDDFVYQIGLEAHHLLLRGDKNEFSVSGRGLAGNFQSEIALATTYRFGTDLASTFGSTSTQAGNNIDVSLLSNSSEGSFFFFTLEARYRFNDITIEGDMPAENADLTIKNIQAAASTGITYYKDSFGAMLSFTIQSKQFTTSRYDHHTFGNVTFFYRF